jgi:hypothetical protein
MPEEPTKPGVKTTEFWLTLATSLFGAGGMLTGVIPEQVGAIIMAVVTAIYSISRALAKQKQV